MRPGGGEPPAEPSGPKPADKFSQRTADDRVDEETHGDLEQLSADENSHSGFLAGEEVLIWKKMGSFTEGYDERYHDARVVAVEGSNALIWWMNQEGANKEEVVEVKKLWKRPDYDSASGQKGRRWDFSKGKMPYRHCV